MSLVEILVAAGTVLLLGSAMLLGVLDQSRRARDAERVSQVRQAQAAVEAYRARYASYPGAADDLPDAGDAALAASFGYAAEPQGCGADQAEQCRAYALSFSLEGAVGTLNGKTCTANPQGLSCSR